MKETPVEKSLEEELKEMIISVCNLQACDIIPDNIKDNDLLIDPNSHLGIDSLDAIEIVAAVEKNYGVRINNINTAQKVLQSIRTLADFIQEEKSLK